MPGFKKSESKTISSVVVKMTAAAMLLLACLFLRPSGISAQSALPLSRGQVIYVPVYSHIYIGDRERPFLLAVTLSIRNTDPKETLSVRKVTYHDSNGVPLTEFIKKPITLNRLSSTRFVVRESDKSGGSGASFIVEWESTKPINPPLVETVMIGAQTQQGISFTSRGRVLTEK